MAFLTRELSGHLKIIVSVDSAIGLSDDKREKQYQKYLESFKDGQGDEALLELKGVPTRFICKEALDWLQSTKLRSKNIKIRGKNAEIDINYNSDLVRRHLVGIENPPGIDEKKALKFTKENDGFASFQIMEQLDRAGALTEISAAIRNNAEPKEQKDAVEKND